MQLSSTSFDTPRCGVFGGMGTGKTSATLTALDLLEVFEPGPALVIAPLLVASQTWPDEVKNGSIFNTSRFVQL